jgi:hypothetical protein
VAPRPRLLEGFGDHHRDRLMVMLNPGRRAEERVLRSPLVSLPAFSAVTIASTPDAALPPHRPSTVIRPLAIAPPTT